MRVYSKANAIRSDYLSEVQQASNIIMGMDERDHALYGGFCSQENEHEPFESRQKSKTIM